MMGVGQLRGMMVFNVVFRESSRFVCLWRPAQAGLAAVAERRLVGLVREPLGSEGASSARSASSPEGASSVASALP